MPDDNIIPFRLRRGGDSGRLPRPSWAVWQRIWDASLDRLALYAASLSEETQMPDLKIDAPAGQPVITMTRSFNAPRALVWKAMSEPQHLVRWWGPHGHTNKAPEFDFRVGGRWRIETTTADGAHTAAAIGVKLFSLQRTLGCIRGIAIVAGLKNVQV